MTASPGSALGRECERFSFRNSLRVSHAAPASDVSTVDVMIPGLLVMASWLIRSTHWWDPSLWQHSTSKKFPGYVNFHSVSDAERALDTLNYSSIKACIARGTQNWRWEKPLHRAAPAASCGPSATLAFAKAIASGSKSQSSRTGGKCWPERAPLPGGLGNVFAGSCAR